MTQIQQELWQRLELFEIDRPDAAFPFTVRLAKEQGWTPDFSRRVVKEYQRFVLLCLTADHVCCPSEAIDQAWHLHLIFTRNYWNDFCRDTLEQPLHHDPNQGGAGESGKFRDLYQATLASYRKVFGQPPGDIWPTPNRQTQILPQPGREALMNWIRSKIGGIGNPAPVGLIAFATTFLMGCQGASLASIPVLDWSGPDFLWSYVAGLAVTFAYASAVRQSWDARQQRLADDATPPTDLYRLAGMAGGSKRMAEAAITSLAGLGLTNVWGDQPKVLSVVKQPPEGLHAVEADAYEILAAQCPLPMPEAIEAIASSAVIDQSLTQVDRSNGTKPEAPARGVTALFLLIAIGILKLIIGISREKPVGILVFLLVISVVVLVAMEINRGKAPAWQQRLARGVGCDLQTHLTRMETSGEVLHLGSRFALIAATIGITGLIGTPLEEYVLLMAPPETLGTANKDGGDSGCSGGSDGGSGCGGGSCGGGCGGCGGGD